MCIFWLRGQDLNLRPSGYEPKKTGGFLRVDSMGAMGHSLKREKAPQTRWFPRLENIVFVTFLVVVAGFIQEPTIKAWVYFALRALRPPSITEPDPSRERPQAQATFPQSTFCGKVQ